MDFKWTVCHTDCHPNMFLFKFNSFNMTCISDTEIHVILIVMSLFPSKLQYLIDYTHFPDIDRKYI